MLAEATIAERLFACKSYSNSKGGAEHFISITAPAELGLSGQLDYVNARYAEARKALGISSETAVFRRLFVSDAVNQAAVVSESALYREPRNSPVAVSLVQQPPLGGAKLALQAYHIVAKGITKHRLSPKHVIVEKNGLRHLWSTRLCAGSHCPPVSAHSETTKIFNDLIEAIACNGGNLREHCVRTWLYIKDVDVFYGDMVESRGKLFRAHGMTEATHYIASTGIEGACEHQFDVVLMDAYSNLDLMPGQISYLEDLSKLCPTKAYNVHFERGTKVSYADRAHYFISGTASIDAAGKVVHPGNVMRQLERALINVDALLGSGGASLDDMMNFIVYLRDATDYPRVHDYFCKRFPDVPVVFVKGPVCRPEWLIEVEGMAIATNDAPELPSF